MTGASNCRRDFLFFSIAAGMSGASISQDSVTLRNKATQEMMDGDWDTALKILLGLPRGNLSGDDLYALALCSHNLGKPADALRYSSLAISLKSLSPKYVEAANWILRAAAGDILSSERITARYGMSDEEGISLNAEKAAERKRRNIARMRDEVDALLSARNVLGQEYTAVLHASEEIKSGMPDEGLSRLFDNLAKAKPQSALSQAGRIEPVKLPIPQ